MMRPKNLAFAGKGGLSSSLESVSGSPSITSKDPASSPAPPVFSPIPRDFSMSPFSRIKNDLEHLIDDGASAEDESIFFKGRQMNEDVQSFVDRKEPFYQFFKEPFQPLRSSSAFGNGHNLSLKPPTRTGSALAAGKSNHHPQQQQQSISGTKSLWVGNLDPTLTEDDLVREFERFGLVESLRLIPSKECAFVNYFETEDARKARDAMHGKLLGNMIIRVGYGKAASTSTLDAPMIESAPCGNSGENPSRSIWVGQIGPEVDVDMLLGSFSAFGPIESCRILDAKGCGFVNFYHLEHAIHARKAMNGIRLGDSVIKTGFARSANNPHNNPKSSAALNPASEEYHAMDETDAVIFGINAFDGKFQNFSEKSHSVFSPPVGSSALLSPPIHSFEQIYQLDSPTDYGQSIPGIPLMYLNGSEMLSQRVREYRKRIEQIPVPSAEFDHIMTETMNNLLACSIDPIGNILVQRLIERGPECISTSVLLGLGPYLPAVGIHKNGTWVVQKLIAFAHQPHQRYTLARILRKHLVPLLQDQYGNYVIQCCLPFGPLNQFIIDGLAARTVDVAASRFGSRAMKSILEAPELTMRQQKIVAMSIIRNASVLAYDPNGVIALQWLLDADLPGRFGLIAEALRGSLVSLATLKHSSNIVAKLMQQQTEPQVRGLLLDELVFGAGPESLRVLLQDPMAAAIITKALNMADDKSRLRLIATLRGPLKELSPQLTHLQRLYELVCTGEPAVVADEADPVVSTSFGPSLGMLDRARAGPMKISLSFGTLPTLIDANVAVVPKETAPPQQSKKTLSFGPGLIR